MKVQEINLLVERAKRLDTFLRTKEEYRYTTIAQAVDRVEGDILLWHGDAAEPNLDIASVVEEPCSRLSKLYQDWLTYVKDRYRDEFKEDAKDETGSK